MGKRVPVLNNYALKSKSHHYHTVFSLVSLLLIVVLVYS